MNYKDLIEAAANRLNYKRTNGNLSLLSDLSQAEKDSLKSAWNKLATN